MIAFVATLGLLGSTPTLLAGDTPELGRVHFGRDLDVALRTSRDTKRPVFLLFQEIPGCSTCRNFGAGPLSHPLLVEAIETLFVPVAIRNNVGGPERETLERYHEPAQNNPVVRFLDADGHDLVAREEGLWSSGAIAARMTTAIEKTGAEVPAWLRLATFEFDDHAPQHLVFAMHCFWEGQAALGAVDGVLDAEPGYVGGAEVVDVSFRPSKITAKELVRRANALDCALRVFAADEKLVSAAHEIVGDRAHSLDAPVRAAGGDDDLRHLRASKSRSLLPLTRLQAVRMNSALAKAGADVDAVPSPRQRELLSRIERALTRKPLVLEGLTPPTKRGVDLVAYADDLLLRLARAE